jgi:hypothetical protein
LSQFHGLFELSSLVVKFVFFLAENKPEFRIFRLVRVRALPSPSCTLYEPEANWSNGGMEESEADFRHSLSWICKSAKQNAIISKTCTTI